MKYTMLWYIRLENESNSESDMNQTDWYHVICYAHLQWTKMKLSKKLNKFNEKQ